MAAVTGLVAAVAWIAVAFQLPGLARRDMQDRSIEFWSSLPVSHAASVSATLLMHGVLVPMLALCVGFLASLVVGVTLIAVVLGPGALVHMSWGVLAACGLAGLARVLFGLCLAALWSAPLLLVPMVASAGLKRWGVPVVIATLGIGGLVLDKLYGITVIGDTVGALVQHAGQALLHVREGTDVDVHIGKNGEHISEVLAMFPQWVAEDALLAVRDLASPLFAFALAVSAACFAALVQLRRRAA
jgi:ABC-2 type transport system permease protein